MRDPEMRTAAIKIDAGSNHAGEPDGEVGVSATSGCDAAMGASWECWWCDSCSVMRERYHKKAAPRRDGEWLNQKEKIK
jgi:hypothetical protein